LPAQQVPLTGQLPQELPVFEGRLLQTGVSQVRGGVFQVGDQRCEVDPVGADEQLHRPGETVQPAAVGRDQRVLLAGSPQAEVHRARSAHHRRAIGTEIHNTVGADRGSRQPQPAHRRLARQPSPGGHRAAGLGREPPW
jgi:hypothetical protein